MKLPETKTLPLDQIKPYENNPRRIPDDAVEAVKTSIERFGYTQPIVVDRDHVIIVGHTRHRALTELGYDKIEVYVSDLPEEKAREYRLVDNRTGEMTGWDHEALVTELREFEESLLEQFFPDVDLEIGLIEDAGVTDEDVEKAIDRVTTVRENVPADTTQVECPSCFHVFEVRTDALPGVTEHERAS